MFSVVNLETGHHVEFRDVEQAHHYAYTHPTEFDPIYTEIDADTSGREVLNFYHNENHRIAKGVLHARAY